MSSIPGGHRRGFSLTTACAIALCLAGAVSIFAPWIRTAYSPYGGWFQPGQHNGFFTWHGVPTALTFVLLFLLLVATSPLHPVPLWRSILLLVGGCLVVLFTGLFIQRWTGYALVEVQGGAYCSLGLGIGLLFLGALEIRGLLLRRFQRQEGQRFAEPPCSVPDRGTERPMLLVPGKDIPAPAGTDPTQHAIKPGAKPESAPPPGREG